MKGSKMDESRFQNELLSNYEKAAVLGVNAKRAVSAIKSRGAAAYAHDLIKRGIMSDGFEQLAGMGKLSLSLEATAVKSEYAQLFSDDEVNACYALLCEYNYF